MIEPTAVGRGREQELAKAAEDLFAALDARREKIVLAESCTGGMAAAALTELAGASRILWGSIVCYSVAAKTRLLAVDAATIRRFGVVSRETAEAMARGALAASDADWSAAVTGFAGPDVPAEEGAPGRVCIAWMQRGLEPRSEELRFEGGRHEIREAAALRLLEGATPGRY